MTSTTSAPSRRTSPLAGPAGGGRGRASQHAGAPRQRARSDARYRRRRAIASVLVASAVGAAALVADSVLTGPGGVPASAAGAGTAPASAARFVRAAPGDSLWTIAESHRGEIAITRYVEELIDLNGGTGIEVGQRVRLP